MKWMHGILLGGLVLVALPAEADLAEKLTAALASDIRSEQEKARDENRRPLETLQFFGLKEDMQVLELIPGTGWYTKLLAAGLRDSGKLSVALGTRRVKENLLDLPEFDQVELIEPDGFEFQSTEQRGIFDISAVDLGADRFDAVLTFRNMHNLTAAARKTLNAAVFTALKPGGIYGVIDHTRRHMQADDTENRRRMDPVLAVKELQQAGFVFVDYSDLHYRPDDELRYEVGRKSVTGNTDRFTLLFKKPAD